jgi:putative transposase
LIRRERRILPRSGGKKLYHLVKDELAEQHLKYGRDKFFAIMRNAGLLVPKRRCYIQTTDSKGWMKQYQNLAKGFKVTAPEQLWVSDITYISTSEGFSYLSLITDAFSRKIVGYKISDNMETAMCVEALQMAISKRLTPKEHKIIHHSDRGLQYCSKLYWRKCNAGGLIMSTTQDGNPYDNALAERMNRTIKEEFLIELKPKTRALAEQLIRESIELYNNYRPHLSLQMKTPNYVHKNSLVSIKKPS